MVEEVFACCCYIEQNWIDLTAALKLGLPLRNDLMDIFLVRCHADDDGGGDAEEGHSKVV